MTVPKWIVNPDEIDDINALNTALILDKCEAIVQAGAGTLAELARELGKPPQRASEWVTQRKYKPDADTLFKMRNWASSKTLGIATTENKSVQRAYRSAFREVQQRRGK